MWPACGAPTQPAYAGTAYTGARGKWWLNTQICAVAGRPGVSHNQPSRDWIPIRYRPLFPRSLRRGPSPAGPKPATCPANTTPMTTVTRLVSCASVAGCTGATCLGYQYYVCRGRSEARVWLRCSCTARYAPAVALDQLVWQDLRQILHQPHSLPRAARAQTGEWLPKRCSPPPHTDERPGPTRAPQERCWKSTWPRSSAALSSSATSGTQPVAAQLGAAIAHGPRPKHTAVAELSHNRSVLQRSNRLWTNSTRQRDNW